MRIELLDPKYREQRRDLDAKRAQQSALYAGADPSRFLKQFAGARTDIFGQKAEEEARARREEEERRQAKEREKIVWDGHAASRTNTVDQYQKTINLEEQIANIQRRHRLNAEESNIGPQMGPSQQGPAGYDQGMPPQAEGMPPNLPPGVGLPGRPPMPSYMSQDGSGSPVPPSGPSAGSPAPGIHPSRMQAGIDPSRAAGLKRPAEGEPAEQPPPQRPAMMEQSEGGYPGMQQPYYGGPPPGVPAGPAAMGSMSPPAGAPTAPRQDAPRPPVQVNSLPKKTDGTLYPEEDWLRYNHMPVTLSIKLPDAPNVSPKCDGSTVTFEALPPASPVSAIRDRVHAEILESTVGASKLKLEVNGKAMTLKQTLAYWNLLDGDTITVSLRK